MTRLVWAVVLCSGLLAGCTSAPKYDVIIRHGTVYDGTGGPARNTDVALLNDRIAVVGHLGNEHGRDEVATPRPP